MRKQVMSLAWALIKATNNTITDLSTALRLAWRRFKLITALSKGKVQVEFVKGCGEVVQRVAVLAFSGGKRPLSVLFSDLNDGGAIKSLRVDRLISYTQINITS